MKKRQKTFPLFESKHVIHIIFEINWPLNQFTIFHSHSFCRCVCVFIIKSEFEGAGLFGTTTWEKVVAQRNVRLCAYTIENNKLCMLIYFTFKTKMMMNRRPLLICWKVFVLLFFFIAYLLAALLFSSPPLTHIIRGIMKSWNVCSRDEPYISHHFLLLSRHVHLFVFGRLCTCLCVWVWVYMRQWMWLRLERK